jgi:hypothetical protein
LFLVEALDCDDHSFNELEDFGEIALPDDANFVINDVMDSVVQENSEVLQEQEEEEAKPLKIDEEVKLE